MSDLTDQLKDIYAQATEAFIAKDVEAIDGFTAPGFTADDGHTKKDRTAFMEGIQRQFQTMDVLSWDREIKAVRQDGDTVIAQTEGEFVAKRRDDGSEVRLLLKNEDAWAKEDGRWIILWARALE